MEGQALKAKSSTHIVGLSSDLGISLVWVWARGGAGLGPEADRQSDGREPWLGPPTTWSDLCC